MNARIERLVVFGCVEDTVAGRYVASLLLEEEETRCVVDDLRIVDGACAVPRVDGYDGREIFRDIKTGDLVLTTFSTGRNGPEATMIRWSGYGRARRMTDYVLVPSRRSGWTPKPEVAYQVRLVRRVDKGNGNRQIWAVSPHDARACETHATVAGRIPEIRLKAERTTCDINQKALRALHAYAQTVDLGDASVKKDTSSTHYRRLLEKELPSPTCGEFEGETSTSSETSHSRRIGYYGPTRWSETGVATVTWAGMSGHYRISKMYEERLNHYESDDGGQRSSRYQARDRSRDGYEYLDGDQPVEAYERLREELDRRVKDAAWINECRVTETRRIATRIVAALTDIPGLPAGARLGEDATWRLVCYVGDRIPVVDIANDLPTLDEISMEILGRPLS